MKRITLVFTILIIVVAGSYLAYNNWKKKEAVALWELVPENAAIVYESTSSIAVWNRLLESDLWKSLKGIEEFTELNKGLRVLDSLGGESGKFSELLGNGFLVSIHKTSKNAFDFLWILDITKRRQQETALEILEGLKSEGGYVTTSSKYLDFEIQQMSNSINQREFSYLIYDNRLIASATSFLVEDVARQIESRDMGFNNMNKDLFQLPMLSKDDGNIYINIENISQYLGLFLDSKNGNALSKFKYLGASMFFDLSIQSDRLSMNGFGVSEKGHFLDIFRNQKPLKSPFRYYIPNRTSLTYELLFSDAHSWYAELETYWKKYDPQYFIIHEEKLAELEYDMSKMIKWLDKGIALTEADPISGNSQDRLLFIGSSDLNEALSQLNRFSERIARIKGDSIYAEVYADLEIRELGLKEFPMMVFGPMFSGFENIYYTTFDGLIILGNNIESIKGLIDDVQSENTWGRSVKYSQFISGNLEEYNLNLTVNTERIWLHLTKQFDDKWRKFADDNERSLKNFRLLSAQFSALDENYYASISVDHEKQDIINPEQRFNIEGEIFIGRDLISKPKVVKNHITNQLEVALQDSAMNLILISSDGEELWRLPLGEKIITDIEQIDFYKNGKLQMFFATSSKVHVIDRMGSYVENYPVKLNGYKIVGASVLDYDKSKNYRFLISDDQGNLCLMNKEGVLLEGWNPNRVSGRLASLPFHLRIRGKDVIIGLQEDGVINLFNRRGEMLRGFPLNTEGRVSGNAFVKKGADLSKTSLIVISENGKLTEFNLSGEILNSDQFYKPSGKTKFTLIPDALGKSYIIARQDQNRLVLLSENKDELLSKDYLSDEVMKIQYYDFSTENKIYVATDETQGFSYVYNKDGTLMNSQPFDSDFEIAMMFFETQMKYRIYSVSGKSLKILSF